MSAVNTWFEKSLPGLIVSRFDDFLTTSGVIGFDVAGDRWTLELGNPEAPVRHEKAKNASLQLTFTTRSFEQFIGGERGEMQIKGRVELLETLAMLMTPLQRDLGWSTF